MRSRASGEVVLHAKQIGLWLKSADWRPTKEGWRHPHLAFPWPTADAVRLQKEADEGMMDPIHRSIREDAWPP